MVIFQSVRAVYVQIYVSVKKVCYVKNKANVTKTIYHVNMSRYDPGSRCILLKVTPHRSECFAYTYDVPLHLLEGLEHISWKFRFIHFQQPRLPIQLPSHNRPSPNSHPSKNYFSFSRFFSSKIYDRIYCFPFISTSCKKNWASNTTGLTWSPPPTLTALLQKPCWVCPQLPKASS